MSCPEKANNKNMKVPTNSLEAATRWHSRVLGLFFGLGAGTSKAEVVCRRGLRFSFWLSKLAVRREERLRSWRVLRGDMVGDEW